MTGIFSLSQVCALLKKEYNISKINPNRYIKECRQTKPQKPLSCIKEHNDGQLERIS